MESEERRERLKRRNQRDRDCRAAERKARLARWRVGDRAHRISQSAAQQERVLDYRRGQLASETPDQRTSRLQAPANEPYATDETDP